MVNPTTRSISPWNWLEDVIYNLTHTSSNGSNSSANSNPPPSDITTSQTTLTDTPLLVPQVIGTDGQVNISVPAASSISTAAGNKMRLEAYDDVGSTLRTIADSLNETEPVMTKLTYENQFWSTGPFGVHLFVLFTENGEGVTSTDSNSYDLSAAILAATPAQNKVLHCGPLALGRMFMDNGTVRYTARLSVDLSKLAQSYVRYYSQKEMAEESAAELKLGICVIAPASTTVNYQRSAVWAYKVKPRKAYLGL